MIIFSMNQFIDLVHKFKYENSEKSPSWYIQMFFPSNDPEPKGFQFNVIDRYEQ